MPRHNPNTRLDVMDARVAVLEASVAAISDSMDAHFATYLSNFARELACMGRGVSSSSSVEVHPVQILTDPADAHDLEPNHTPRRDFLDDGGGTPQAQWQHHIDFSRFVLDDDPLAWIYKADQFFNYYPTLEHQKVVTVSFHLDGEALQWFRYG